MGDLHGAIADFTESIAADPSSRDGFSNRGLAYETLNDYERAIADYRRVIELDPMNSGNHVFHDAIGALLQKLAPSDPAFAAAATRFNGYDTQPPAFKLAVAGPGAVKFWLSKPATVVDAPRGNGAPATGSATARTAGPLRSSGAASVRTATSSMPEVSFVRSKLSRICPAIRQRALSPPRMPSIT